MKVTPVATPTPTVNPNEGQSASSDRIARAKAIAAGETLGEGLVRETPEAVAAKASIKRIKMNTQRSPNRHEAPAAAAVEAAPVEGTPVEATESDTLAPTEQVQEPEATVQTDPQYAALAKAKRALQAKEREIAAREAALAKPSDTMSGGYTKDQIKANALSILRDAGVTNDELTESLLREASDYGPGFTKLETELKAVKEAIENQNKNLVEREQAAEKQALSLIQSDVEHLVSQGEEFEAIRTQGAAPKVVELIHRVFKQDGVILDNTEAARLIENELINDALKFASLKKVQSRISPAAPAPSAKPGASAPMRTLTNRDGISSSAMSRRERAIAAMEGRLK